MVQRTVRILKRGLSDAERSSMTLRDLRLHRLELLQDGHPVTRSRRDPSLPIDQQRTTSPTMEAVADHLSQTALQIGSSTWRSFETGAAEPRLTISQMAHLSDALGLNLEELYSVTRNSMLARAKRLASAVEQ